jgi:hypothetical protein
MNVFVEHSSFFAAPYLAEALHARYYVMSSRYNDFFGISNTVMGIKCGENTEKIKSNTDITIIGYLALQKILKRIERGDFKRVNLILSDSRSCKYYKEWNEFVPKNNNIHLYLMPDIIPYCSIEYKPIYQYMKIHESLILPKQTDRLLITHSPRGNPKFIKKGTPAIIKIIEDLQKKYDFEFKLITNLSMDDALKEKSRAHIHIDQLIYGNEEAKQTRFDETLLYAGGLGKSGIEGMLLNCCVITSGIPPITAPHFPPPPITWTSYNTFYEDLENLIISEKLRNKHIRKQNKWLLKYHTRKFYKNYLTT